MNYRPLYILRIEHDYFDQGVCRALGFRISSTESSLWRRRGLLLRQTAANEWIILYDGDGAGVDTDSDVLALDMDMTDPSFVLYTEWADFHPSSAYVLELPIKEDRISAEMLKETALKRRIGAGFCQVRIRLTSTLFQEACQGKPMQAILHFGVPACRWEYLLIPRAGVPVTKEEFTLEEAGDKLHFPPFEPVRMYGQDMFRTVSEESVPMHERYGYKLKVFSSVGDGRKQGILKHVATPEPGRFLDAEKGMVRQVCNL